MDYLPQFTLSSPVQRTVNQAESELEHNSIKGGTKVKPIIPPKKRRARQTTGKQTPKRQKKQTDNPSKKTKLKAITKKKAKGYRVKKKLKNILGF